MLISLALFAMFLGFAIALALFCWFLTEILPWLILIYILCLVCRIILDNNRCG